jgi:hypothetical protein
MIKKLLNTLKIVFYILLFSYITSTLLYATIKLAISSVDFIQKLLFY